MRLLVPSVPLTDSSVHLLLASRLAAIALFVLALLGASLVR